MSKFIDDDDLKKVDLGDSEWIKIPKRFSYKFVEELNFADSNLKPSEKSIVLLSKSIKEWNLKDSNGLIPNITEDNIKRLDMQTINLISEEITSMMMVEKKDFPTSGKQ